MNATAMGLRESELPLLKDMADHGGSAYALATTYAAPEKRREALAYLHLSFDRREEAMLVVDPIPALDTDLEYQKFRAQMNQSLAR